MRNIFNYPGADFPGFRLMEVPDNFYSLKNLKGDCYDPDYNTNIDADELKKQEIGFEKMVLEEGVYGYVLERWNPAIGVGWEEVESCYGFVGPYSLDNDHYIVEEMANTAKNLIKEGTI